MRKSIAGAFIIVVCCTALFMASSCDKGGNPYPTINFRQTNTSVSYVSKDTTLYRGTIFNVGIEASKTGPDGFLKSFKITRSINNGPDTTLLQASLNTVYFSQFYSYTAGDSGNLEHYTFTIGNANGLYTSVAFTDTVN